MHLGLERLWPAVPALLFIGYQICKPIVWVLIKVLGGDPRTVCPKNELVELAAEHKGSLAFVLGSDEERILKGTMQFSEKSEACYDSADGCKVCKGKKQELSQRACANCLVVGTHGFR